MLISPNPVDSAMPAQRARALLDASPSALAWLGADGSLAWANAAALRLLGDAAVGRPLAELLGLSPTDRRAWQDRLDGIDTAPLTVQVHPAGCWLRLRCSALADGGHALDLLPVDDCVQAQTAAHRLSDLLEVSRVRGELGSQLALAVDLVGIAIWRHDLATDRVQLNDQAWNMVDLEPRAQGLHIDELASVMHPQDLPRVLESARAALQSSGPVDVESRYRRRSGDFRHILARRAVERDSAGRPLAFIGVGIDITEQRSASLALRRAGERIALATRGAGLGTWEADLRGQGHAWDEQMWRLFGREPRPVAPTLDERMAFVHPEDRDAAFRQTTDTMASDRAGGMEFRARWPDGSLHWLASRSAPVRDEAGAVVRRIGVVWDITEARNAEIARHEREIARRESQAKSQFLSRVSHELRTPLNAVLGFTQLLIDDETEPGSMRARRLHHVRSAAGQLLALIDDVLDLSSVESGEVRIALAPVPLAPLVAQNLPLLEPLQRAHGVAVHCGALDVVPLADPTRLRQVLLNLLSNAIKYNRAGGSVSIDARQRSGGGLVISVRDTGRGMDDEQMRHLFEPFNRLGVEHEGIAGTGIGLAIVKVLVERMGGSVHVDSTPGEGTLFELRLIDGASEPAPAPATDAAPAVPSGRRRRQLLYIEDNPVNAMIVVELLARRPDLELHCAIDGASGIAMTTERLPDLVLLDMQLPDVDGHEVLRRLRADPRTASIPVIALSANAMPSDIERALAAGVADYWTKPLDFRAFMASLDALFGPLQG